MEDRARFREGSRLFGVRLPISLRNRLEEVSFANEITLAKIARDGIEKEVSRLEKLAQRRAQRGNS